MPMFVGEPIAREQGRAAYARGSGSDVPVPSSLRALRSGADLLRGWAVLVQRRSGSGFSGPLSVCASGAVKLGLREPQRFRKTPPPRSTGEHRRSAESRCGQARSDTGPSPATSRPPRLRGMRRCTSRLIVPPSPQRRGVAAPPAARTTFSAYAALIRSRAPTLVCA
jgi:hypothetical protein